MNESCALVPRVKRREGKKVVERESLLFQDIKAAVKDYETAWNMYAYTKSQDFLKRIDSNAEYDELGEVTFPYFIKTMGWEDAYNESKGADSISREYHIKNRTWEDPREAITVANEINRKEKKFVCHTVKDGNVYRLEIVPRTPASEISASEYTFNNTLSNEIVAILRKLGFDITIDSSAEYAGIFDPTNPTMREGLIQIIRIARGEVGEEALPEEFSHLIIRGLKNHPLVKRLLESLDEETVEKILGDEFEKYSEKYENDQDRLAEEAAGKLLSDYIINKGTLHAQETKKRGSLLARIWRWAKNLLSRITNRDLQYAGYSAQKSVEAIYKMIATNEAIPLIDKHNILGSDALYRITSSFNDLQAQVNKCRTRHAYIVNANRQMFDKKLTKGDYDLQQMMEAAEEQDADVQAVALGNFLVEVENRIAQLQEEYGKIKEGLKNGTMTEIEQFNRASKIVTMIQDITGVNGYGGVVNTLCAFGENADEITGVSQADINSIVDAANRCRNALSTLRNGAVSITINLLVNSFRTVFSKDRQIEGMNTPQAYLCLEEIIDHALRDVGWADKWFTAMSDADDPLLVLVDSMVKTQQYKRDTKMNEIFKKIALEDKKLKDAGYDSSFMLELNKDGKPTERILSIYDFDSYTEEKAAFKKALIEAGKSPEDIRIAMQNWKAKTDENGEPRIITVYVNPEYQKLHEEGRTKEIPENAATEELPNPKRYNKKANALKNLSEAQRKYYDNMIQLKREMMSLIPHRGQYIYRAINISQGVADNIFNENTGNPLSVIAESLKKKFIRRPDDLGFGITDDTRRKIKDIVTNETDPDKAAEKVVNLLATEIDADIKMFIKPAAIKRQITAHKGNIDETVEAIMDRIAMEDFYLVDVDFGGQRLQKIPIYYSRKLSNPDLLSRDFSGCMTAYAAMAINYGEMSKIVDILELLRGHMNSPEGRQILENEGNGPMTAVFKVAGNRYKTTLRKPGSKSKSAERMDSYMESVMYEQRKKTEELTVLGTNVNMSKLLDTLRDYSGLLGLGLNLFSTFSNITVGKVQQWIEAAGGEYFGVKDYVKAIGQYHELIMGHMAEMGNPLKKNKLSLLIEMFDPMGDYFESLRTKNLNKSLASKVFGNNALGYVGMHAGEHLLHCQTMLAILNATKLKKENGEVISLFDALEVKEKDSIYRLELIKGLSYERNVIDDSGSKESNKNWGKLKKDENGNYVKELVSLDNKDSLNTFLFKRRRVIRKVNDFLNGAFSADDKGAVHRYAVMRLVMQFRQWMPAHYSRRFARGHWDDDLEQWREGYYITVLNITNEIFKDIKKGQYTLIGEVLKGEHYTEHELANLRRAATEVGMFVTLLILTTVGDHLKDKNSSWGQKMLLYQLHRMLLEVGASVPSPTFIKNAISLLNSPAPVINTLERITNILKAGDMFHEIERGRYKGWSEWQKDLFVLMPYTDQFMKAYYFDDSMFTPFTKNK